MRKWEDLPEYMKCDEVKEYYDILSKKKFSLKMKRAFDLVAGTGVLIVTAIPMLIISVKIATESKGGVFYRQERVTTYGKKFRIHKFRTMVANADQIGSAVTVSGDCRITPTGAFLRKYRLDELPQIFDVLSGDMSFVGTRPEVTKYVKKYSLQKQQKGNAAKLLNMIYYNTSSDELQKQVVKVTVERKVVVQFKKLLSADEKMEDGRSLL